MIGRIARSWKPSRRAWVAILVVLVAWAGVVGGIFAVERTALWRDRNGTRTRTGPYSPMTRRFDAPGLERPPVVPAAEAGLGDDEEVIGVVAGGRARAYRLRSLEYIPWHVVNDVVGGVPVTVAHCDLSGCTRAYEGEPGGGPLDVAQAGLFDGEMVVKARGAAYVHRTGLALDPAAGAGSLPYRARDYTRTTWKAWRERYPESDVFVGIAGQGPNRAEARPSPPPGASGDAPRPAGRGGEPGADQ